MKRTCVLILALLCLAPGRKKVQSPKDTELSATAGAPMKLSSPKLVLAPPIPIVSLLPLTNFVVRKRFEWEMDPEFAPFVSTYTLYMGTNSGVYNWSVDTGTNLFYELVRTNWEERPSFHFVMVTARDKEYGESPPSNEVHFPVFPATHVRISWQIAWAECALYCTTNLFTPQTNWTYIAGLVGATNYSELIDRNAPAKFYYLDKPDMLTITLFNPNP